ILRAGFRGAHKKWKVTAVTVLYNWRPLVRDLHSRLQLLNIMAFIGNKLYRGLQTKQDEATEIDQQLGRLEEDIRKLKIEFDIYFNGGTKRPPLESRARL